MCHVTLNRGGRGGSLLYLILLFPVSAFTKHTLVSCILHFNLESFHQGDHGLAMNLCVSSTMEKRKGQTTDFFNQWQVLDVISGVHLESIISTLNINSKTLVNTSSPEMYSSHTPSLKSNLETK